MNHDLLAGYISRAELAQSLCLNERTIYRYENQPDGLPCMVLGGRKLYKLETVRKWIEGREKRPNPRRQALR